MKVIGYLNDNKYYPSALITITVDPANNNYFLFYPNGENIEIEIDTKSRDYIDTVILEKKDFNLLPGQYSYGINSQNILFGTHKQNLKKLENLINENNLPKREHDLIDKFIKSEHLFHKSETVNETHTPLDIVSSLRPFEEMGEKIKESVLYEDSISIKEYGIKLFELIAPKIERREELL